MTDSGINGGEADAPIPSPTPSFDPFFKMWSDWLSNSMGPMTTVPAASLPWLAKPGVSTGEEAEPFPSGAMANSDPRFSAPEWDSNPFYAMLAAVYHTQDTQV
jgi:hypothetical protein